MELKFGFQQAKVTPHSMTTWAHQVAIARHYGSLRKFRAVDVARAEVRRACLADFAVPHDTQKVALSLLL